MPGRSISGYVEDYVAERLHAAAREEGRAPAKLVGQAVSLYTSLPEAARNAFRRIEATASPEEKHWFRGELVRLLLKTDMGLTQRRMAEEVKNALPAGDTEEDIEQAAIEWTAPSGP